MKKLSKLFLLVVFIGLTSCVGDEGVPGPPGPPGRNGLDGLDGEEAFVFEYSLNFTAPDYSVLLDLPAEFTMLDSDVMLVYLLWEITEDGVEIWRQLPQTLFFADGLLHYNYDFTKFDASLFLDGTVNLDLLGADYTDNWIARVVVVPGQFTNGRLGIDFSDYNEVKAYFKLSSSKLAPPDYTKRPE